MTTLTTTTATVAWTTNEAATSRVEYGASETLGSFFDNNLIPLPTHSRVLTGLMPGTAYHYRVHSIDPALNEGVSGDLTFATP